MSFTYTIFFSFLKKIIKTTQQKHSQFTEVGITEVKKVMDGNFLSLRFDFYAETGLENLSRVGLMY